MSDSRLSIAHPLSSPFSRNAAIAFSEADLLHEIITTLVYNPTGVVSRYLDLLPNAIKHPILKELGRRTWIPPKDTPIRTYPWKQAIRVSMAKIGLSHVPGLDQQSLGSWACSSLDHQVAKYHLQNLNGIYAYENSALETFRAAKQRGILCFYDLPIAFYKTSQKIQQEEAERFPEFISILQTKHSSAWKTERKEEEVQLADHIFVPSSFVKQSLLDDNVSPEKVSVTVFGAPTEYFQPQPKADSCFRALFVGRVGSRKGVHYLLKAWQQLNLPSDAELTLVGVNEFPKSWIQQYQDLFTYIPSVPHNSLNRYYSDASVLVFPSLVEGLALVQLEAMACGIPIITTANAGGSDIITDGVEGFIIPIRDVDALQEKIEWCYQNPDALAEMGKAARKKAEELTWQLYRQRLATKVQEVLATHKAT